MSNKELIIGALELSGEPMTAIEIVRFVEDENGVDLQKPSVAATLSQAEKKGLVTRVGTGMYALVEKEEETTLSKLDEEEETAEQLPDVDGLVQFLAVQFQIPRDQLAIAVEFYQKVVSYE